MIIGLIQKLDFALMPTLVFFALGLILLYAGSRKAKPILIFTFIFLIVSSNRILPQWVMSNLENHYPPLLSASQIPSPVRFILVLGAASSPNLKRPITSQMGISVLIRLTEGLRLLREFPNAKLILSGGGKSGVKDAHMMERFVLSQGLLAPDRFLIEDKSINTYEQALYLKDLLGNEPFILVTSARHMPRAISLFECMGLHPIAAPTDYLTNVENLLTSDSLVPRAGFISLWSNVLYEYLGLFKAKLSGNLSC